jgi:hypothetical protein
MKIFSRWYLMHILYNRHIILFFKIVNIMPFEIFCLGGTSVCWYSMFISVTFWYILWCWYIHDI